MWIQRMLLTDALMGWSDHLNVITPTGAVYQQMLRQLHPAGDDVNKMIAEISPCPQVLCIGGCWDSCIRPKIISAGWLSAEWLLSPWPMDVVKLGDGGRCIRLEKWVWANSQWGTNNITNGNKEVRCGRNHSQRKRGNAAGHVRVVDYISPRFLAKISCSLALPTPNNSFVCANTLLLLFCSTQVSSPRIKNII